MIRDTFVMLSPSDVLTPLSDKISIYVSDEEPTEDTLSFLSVPYTRYVPNDEDVLPLVLAELVSHDITGELRSDEATCGPCFWLIF